MADKDVIQLKDGELPPPGRVVAYGSKEHAQLLHSGYTDFENEKEARDVLASEKSSTEERRNARAFLAALTTKPVVVSRRPGWHKIRGR
jgi:hypothetical protein